MLPPDCAPSSIPEDAEEVLIETEEHEGWPTELVFSCRFNGEVVGSRQRTEDGRLLHEHGLRNDRYHGWWRDWDEHGQLTFEGFRVDGAEHGVARQWCEGRLIGWYTMDHGTGLDLWRHADGSLAEERHLEEGGWRSYERLWRFGENKAVWWEKHFHENREHGIERQWREGRLKRGYPRYWVKGERVTKRQYLSAAKKDATLPPYRVEDDSPERPLPPEYFQTMPPAVPPVMPANPEEWRR